MVFIPQKLADRPKEYVREKAIESEVRISPITYAAARVHAQVRRDLMEADAQALGQTLREQLLRPLTGFNFGWNKPAPWFRFRYEEEEDLKTLSEVYRNLAHMGLPMSLEHVAERFGVTLAQDGQESIGRRNGSLTGFPSQHLEAGKLEPQGRER